MKEIIDSLIKKFEVEEKKEFEEVMNNFIQSFDASVDLDEKTKEFYTILQAYSTLSIEKLKEKSLKELNNVGHFE